MARPRKVAARYLKHASGRARALWNDSTGRRVRLLPGPFNSPESLEAFGKLQLELASSPEMPAQGLEGPTVIEVLAAYRRHAEAYYGHGSELSMINDALKTVRQLYGTDPIANFGPRKLAAVRESFLRRTYEALAEDGSKIHKTWSRSYVNRQIGKIVSAFKWAAAEELIPVSLYHGLKTMAPLRRGHCEARESEPRQPANPAHVAAAIPFLRPHVRAIVELLRCTGMRPAEVCRMSLGEIDRTGDVWSYRPTRHKNAHRGQHRIVALGAAAQAIINAHLDGRALGDSDPLFSPRRQRDERSAELRAKRKSKVQPSQINRRVDKPKRPPGEWFTPMAVGHAVTSACEKAQVPRWTPYQLRHLKGAELRERFSLEHVRAALGHSHASMTAHYAKGADAKLAAEVAATAG